MKNIDDKKRYKLYKSGKLWVTAAVFGMTIGVTSISGYADENSTSNVQDMEKLTNNVDEPKSDSQMSKVEEQVANDKSNGTQQTLVANSNEHMSNSNTQSEEQSVSSEALDKAIRDAESANVIIKEDKQSARKIEIQGVESADSNKHVQEAKQLDNEDYSQQVSDLKTATDHQVAYETALNTGKQQNADGKTQIATAGNMQAFELDQGKPADESNPTGNIQPTAMYSGTDEQASDNMKSSTKVWEYSGNCFNWGNDGVDTTSKITKTWAQSGTIAIKNENGNIIKKSVDLHESFHDFQRQNGNWTDTINYHEQGIPKVTISSNAIDNVEMWNINWQTTFWFTYSDTKEIVPISKMTGANNDPKVYFLSASLSGVKYDGPENPTQWDNWSPNEREYVQTNDAKTVVIQPNSTVGLDQIAEDGVVTNLLNGQGYTQTGQNYPKTDDNNPDIYALQEGVSFTDFTTDTPTLYLGAVPINKQARWWHSNHNMNSDELAFVQKPEAAYHKNTIVYTKLPVITIKEKIDYVDENGNQIANLYLSSDDNNKNFISISKMNGAKEIWTSTGEITNPTIVRKSNIDPETGKEVVTEIMDNDDSTTALSNEFDEVSNPNIRGYHVVKTTDIANDLERTTKQLVYKDEPNQLRKITVTYAKDKGTVLVNYVDQHNKQISEVDESTQDSGTPYKTTARTISGYDLINIPINADGKYPSDQQTTTVTYVYGQQGTNIINYVDEENKPLRISEKNQGPKGDEYRNSPTKISGYHVVLDKTTGENIGRYDTGQSNETTFVYAKNQGKLVVNYVDKNNETLSTADELMQDSGTPYETTAKIIDGYDLVNTPINVNGKYPADQQTTIVTYVYDKLQNQSDKDPIKSVDVESESISETEPVYDNPEVVPEVQGTEVRSEATPEKQVVEVTSDSAPQPEAEPAIKSGAEKSEVTPEVRGTGARPETISEEQPVEVKSDSELQSEVAEAKPEVAPQVKATEEKVETVPEIEPLKEKSEVTPEVQDTGVKSETISEEQPIEVKSDSELQSEVAEAKPEVAPQVMATEEKVETVPEIEPLKEKSEVTPEVQDTGVKSEIISEEQPVEVKSDIKPQPKVVEVEPVIKSGTEKSEITSEGQATGMKSEIISEEQPVEVTEEKIETVPEIVLLKEQSEVKPAIKPSAKNPEITPEGQATEAKSGVTSEGRPVEVKSDIEPQPKVVEAQPEVQSAEVKPETMPEEQPVEVKSDIKPQPKVVEAQPEVQSAEVKPETMPEEQPVEVKSDIKPQVKVTEEKVETVPEIETIKEQSEVTSEVQVTEAKSGVTSEGRPVEVKSDIEPQPKVVEAQPEVQGAEVKPETTLEGQPVEVKSDINPQSEVIEVKPEVAPQVKATEEKVETVPEIAPLKEQSEVTSEVQVTEAKSGVTSEERPAEVKSEVVEAQPEMTPQVKVTEEKVETVPEIAAIKEKSEVTPEVQVTEANPEIVPEKQSVEEKSDSTPQTEVAEAQPEVQNAEVKPETTLEEQPVEVKSDSEPQSEVIEVKPEVAPQVKVTEEKVETIPEIAAIKEKSEVIPEVQSAEVKPETTLEEQPVEVRSDSEPQSEVVEAKPEITPQVKVTEEKVETAPEIAAPKEKSEVTPEVQDARVNNPETTPAVQLTKVKSEEKTDSNSITNSEKTLPYTGESQNSNVVMSTLGLLLSVFGLTAVAKRRKQ